MKEMDRLQEIADRLLAPDGCPWDREQTFFTLQPYLLEEAHELIEAIDSLDSQKMLEELGDVLYALLFIAKLAEKDNRFTFAEAALAVGEKLVRRHPHVFGETTVASSEEVAQKWEEIKKSEKGHSERKGIFDGIPPSLPALPRAQKMAKALRKKRGMQATEAVGSEEEAGERLWQLVAAIEKAGIDAESALRRRLAKVGEAG